MKQKDLTTRPHQNALTTVANKLAVCPQAFPVGTARKRLCTVVLGLGLLVFTVTSARSATWYVDNAATGSNNGTSWANAWTAFSSIVWGSSGVKAGDTLYISGGSTSKTYTSALTIGASGSAGSPITIKLDAANSAHNGTIVFNNAYITVANYVTVDGSVNGASHLMITNIYDPSNKDNGRAVWGTSTTGVKLYYITVSGCNNGFNLQYATSFEIAHCYFTHILGDSAIMTIQSPGATFDMNLIYSNTIYSSGWGADKIQCGDGTSVFGNYFSGQLATGAEVSGQHPDSVQCAGAYLKIYNNEFVDCGDSDIDFDCWAITSPHDIWIYNNVFRVTSNRQSYYSGDYYPDYIRVYKSTTGGIVSFTNWKIFNNTFVDNPNWDAVHFYLASGWGSPTGAGNEIKNNLFYNCGSSSSFRALLIQQSSGFTSSSWALDGNIYYYPSSAGAYVAINGSPQTASSWIAANEPHGKTNAPVFVRYAAYGTNNDFHLASTDAAARNAGVNLSAYFTTDKDGTNRPSSAAWDIGAYQYGAGGSGTNLTPLISVSPTNLNFVSMNNAVVTNTLTVRNAGGGMLTGTASVPSPFQIISGGTYNLTNNQSQTVTVSYSPNGVSTNSLITFTSGSGASVPVRGSITNIPAPIISAITQNGADIDPSAAGLQIFAGSVVQYSGSASDPNGLPLTWQWIYTVNSGSEIVLQSGTGTVASVSFNYTSSTAGNTYVWKLRVSNGYAISESDLTVGVEAPPAGNVIQATSGAINSPFIVTNSYIYQPVQTTTPTNGGSAYYQFTITNAGNYVIQVLVSAPNDGANSLYVNIDAEPQDPTMIWDIPLTSGFEERVVSWRGNGTDTSNQFVPKIFSLSQGTHQLVIRGREANVQLQNFAILQIPLPPQNLRILPL